MSCSFKTILAAAVSGLLLCSGAFAQPYTPEQRAAHAKLYREAQAELKAGKFEAAEAKARSLVRARPTDPYMRRLLVEIQTRKRAARSGTHWERTLRSIVVPSIHLDEVTLDEALEYVRVKAVEKAPAGSPPPSFIIRGDKAKDRTVTLKLSNVPLSELLRIIGDVCDVRISYEKYAIVAHDMRSATTEKPSPKEPGKVPGLESVGSFPTVLQFQNTGANAAP